MAGKKGYRSGASYKAQYKIYAMGSWKKNATRKLEKHIRNFPNDDTAKEALKRLNAGKKVYSRNRKSDGHICKTTKYVILPYENKTTCPTFRQQMEKLGFKSRGRTHKKSTRQSVGRVR